MLFEMHRNAVFPLVNGDGKWRWRLLNRHNRFRKMEMEVFVKIPVIGTVAYNLFLKGNKILQSNILIYFNAIFNVIQRTMIVIYLRWRWRVLNLRSLYVRRLYDL